MSRQNIVIATAKRTPMGAFQGKLSSFKATQLGAFAIRASFQESGLVSPDLIDEVIMGCVLPAGLGQAPARQAALGAGLEKTTPCTTVNKVCGSGMKAVMMAYDQLRLGYNKIIIAGGMESMTNAPYLLDRARSGYRLGHGKILDHMFYDGLEDPYNQNRLMGTFAEDTAEAYKFSREDQDSFAKESLRRSLHAQETGLFTAEMISLQKGDLEITGDEPPTKVNIDKIPSLRPVFREGGTVTAANSSSIADGAAAVMLMSHETAAHHHLEPLAFIKAHTTFAQSPEWFTTAPIGAIKKLCQTLDWPIESIDLFEVNEAFATVTMAAMKDLSIPHEKMNILGGACALGHPVGASGARLIATLAHALKNKGLKRGIAAICLGGGEATAVALERL